MSPRRVLTFLVGAALWWTPVFARAQQPYTIAEPIAPVFPCACLEAEARVCPETCCDSPDNWEILPAGTTTLQIMGGFYHASIGHFGPPMPGYDFAPVRIRVGTTFDYLISTGIFRGKLEPIFEVTAAPVHGFGTYFAGPSLLLRYNYIQPESRLIPYIVGGAGIVFNDSYHDQKQYAIGQRMEFLLEAAFGVRYFLTESMSLDAEGGYMHISNAGLAKRNGGVNGLGGSIGVTFYLPSGRR